MRGTSCDLAKPRTRTFGERIPASLTGTKVLRCRMSVVVPPYLESRVLRTSRDGRSNRRKKERRRAKEKKVPCRGREVADPHRRTPRFSAVFPGACSSSSPSPSFSPSPSLSLSSSSLPSSYSGFEEYEWRKSIGSM